MENEMQNLACLLVAVLLCLCYCFFISAKLPKGLLRLISLVPILCFFTILPLYLTTVLSILASTFFYTWLANGKLLLFAFDQGPLSWDHSKSLTNFVIISAFPINLRASINDPPGRNLKKQPLDLATTALALAVLIGAYINYDFKRIIPPEILLIDMLFIFIEIVVAFSNLFVQAITGLELQPPSDKPYLSTSLGEFWGRRWDLAVTNALRQTVYDPVRSAVAPVVGDMARVPGKLAAFLVSGLMHELAFYYITRVSPSWEATLFFGLQGVFVVVEYELKVLPAGKWQLPQFISCPLTVGFLVATNMWLFFPPLLRNSRFADQ